MEVADTLGGVVLGMLVVAAAVSWPVAWLLLRAYRRSVVAAMQASGQVGSPVRPEGTKPGRPDGNRVAESVEQRWWAGDGVEQHLRDRARARCRAVRGRHLLGGAAAATVLAIATMLASESGFLPLRTLLVWTVSAWPMVLGLVVLSGFDRRVVVRSVAAYLGVLVVLGVAAGDLAAPFLLWALVAGPATIVVVPYLHRSVRAVGVIVVAFVYVGLLGANAVVGFVGASDDRISVVARLVGGFGGGAVVALVSMLGLGFALAGVVGWGGLRWFGWAYRERGLPASLVLVGAIWVLFAAMQGVPLAFTSPPLALAAPGAIVAFWLIASRPVHGKHRHGPRLLVLRVFAGGRRNESLFTGLTHAWQDVGPIRLIGGPDLARSTVEPDAFLDFAGGNLRDRFVTSPGQLERRRHDPREVVDRHGRYRAQEFLCTADTWRPVVHQLMQDTDLVVVDLRALGPGNVGVRDELAMLARLRLLTRTLLVVDAQTDLAVASATIEAAGGRPDRASIVRVDEALGTSDLLGALPTPVGS